MSTIIDKLKDKFGNFVLPVTNTKAVYDDNGNRLDNLLAKTKFRGTATAGIFGTVSDANNTSFISSVSNTDEYRLFSSKTDLGYEKYENGVLQSQWVLPISRMCSISDAYNPSKTYSQGELCIYNNILWKSKVNNNTCNTPAEGSYWTPTNVGNELGKYMVAYVDAPELGEGFRFSFLRFGKIVMVTCTSSIGSQIVPWHALNVIIPDGFRPAIEAPYRDQDATGYFTIFMNPNGSIGVEASNNKLIRMTLTYIVKE